MRTRLTPLTLGAALVACAILSSSVGTAEEQAPAPKKKSTVGEAVRTGGHAARDGALTLGRSTKAFFTGGASAARSTWKENAEKTKENAKDGGRKTREAAHGK